MLYGEGSFFSLQSPGHDERVHRVICNGQDLPTHWNSAMDIASSFI